LKKKASESFCIEAVFPTAHQAELGAAEAWEAGASGVEERVQSDDSTLLLLYAPAETAEAVCSAVARVAVARVGKPQLVVAQNWSEAWRWGLDAIRVGERLVVRPSWIDATGAAAELVIDPGQAFGTGGHVSTRLALEWIEVLSNREAGLQAGSRVLDVGTGTGVLALAALALGAGSAVGFDLDPLAGLAARKWAACNGFAQRFAVFVGPIEALAGPPFDVLVANLLKRELLPLALPMAGAVRPGGLAIFSGLLAREADEVKAALSPVGFQPAESRTAVDPNGDEWISLLMTRA
jgi:ribosomal protein L11 methyltransferase